MLMMKTKITIISIKPLMYWYNTYTDDNDINYSNNDILIIHIISVLTVMVIMLSDNYNDWSNNGNTEYRNNGND